MKSNPAPTEANPQGAREDPYPDPRGGFLARLEELGDILAHLAQLQLPPVPQQLYPRDRQLQQRLAVPRRNGISSQNETRNSLWVPRTRGPAQSKGGEEGRGGEGGRAYHFAPRKPPPLLKKASSIDMVDRREWEGRKAVACAWLAVQPGDPDLFLS
jgi:hypothetical protein